MSSGVLAAQISWSWADEIRDSVTGTLKGDQGGDLLVLNSSGNVILGPAAMLGKTLHLGQQGSPGHAKRCVRRAATICSPMPRRMATAISGGLGWSVLVRQDAQIALAPVRQAAKSNDHVGARPFAAGGARRMGRSPAASRLRSCGWQRAARDIRQGADAQMPELHSYAEAEVLSLSFASLVTDLKQREQALARLNETLESQVADRTRELAIRNEALAETPMPRPKRRPARNRGSLPPPATICASPCMP